MVVLIMSTLLCFVKRNAANMVVSTAGSGNQINATFGAGGDYNKWLD